MSAFTPCGPGLCRCDEADWCRACGEQKAEAGCDGLCENCDQIAAAMGYRDEPTSDPVHDTHEEHEGLR